jgi:hypothetical protein
MAASMIFLGDIGSADELGDDIDLGALGDLVPVGGAEGVRESGQDLGRVRFDGARADGADDELGAELAIDQREVVGQDAQRAPAHVTEPDDADADSRHAPL